jgi:hypothetical protein
LTPGFQAYKVEVTGCSRGRKELLSLDYKPIATHRRGGCGRGVRKVEIERERVAESKWEGAKEMAVKDEEAVAEKKGG